MSLDGKWLRKNETMEFKEGLFVEKIEKTKKL